MAAAVHIPLAEYLSTTYRPDRDYLEGELKERNMGEQPHADVQAIITTILGMNRRNWAIRQVTECRLQISSSRFRIPDIMVLRNTDPKDPIVNFAPLLCVEILSKDDRLHEIQQRIDDYASLGTALTWVVDPWQRIGYHASTQGFLQPDDHILRVPNTPIAVSLPDLFTQLDES
jgi:Uma2 family endonuclease